MCLTSADCHSYTPFPNIILTESASSSCKSVLENSRMEYLVSKRGRSNRHQRTPRGWTHHRRDPFVFVCAHVCVRDLLVRFDHNQPESKDHLYLSCLCQVCTAACRVVLSLDASWDQHPSNSASSAALVSPHAHTNFSRFAVDDENCSVTATLKEKIFVPFPPHPPWCSSRLRQQRIHTKIP